MFRYYKMHIYFSVKTDLSEKYTSAKRTEYLLKTAFVFSGKELLYL